MKEIVWSAGEDGRLLGASVHDGVTQGLQYVAGHDLRFEVRGTDGGLVRVHLAGVQEVTIVEMWERVIVLDISVWPASRVPEHLWRVPDAGWNALLRTRTSGVGAGLVAQRIAARRPEPLLVVLAGSYGGGMAAVCTALRVYTE